MNTLNQIHGGGSGPVNDEGKDEKPKPSKDPILETAEFFERLDRHRPRKPKVIPSFRR